MKSALAALGAALLATGVAVAQPFPDDPGLGVERGIQQLNNSGEVGTVTLFNHAPDTLVFVRVHGAAPGRVQPVRIYRGADCDSLAPTASFVLSDVHAGVSRTLVHISEDRLLSGNYNVVVLASTSPHTIPVACGHLYAR